MKQWRYLALFLTLKLGLMYLIRVAIRKNLRDMERRGIVLPKMPQ